MVENDSDSSQVVRTKESESFGDFLRRHREGSGKSLEAVAAVTRISIHYLRAFEQNQPSRLPAPAFARGFLRAYAQEIGLDPDLCAERFSLFQRSIIPTEIREMTKDKYGGILGHPERQITPRQIFLIGSVVGVFLVAGSIYFLNQKKANESPTTELDADATSSESGVEPEEPPAVEIPDTTKVPPPIEAIPVPKPTPKSGTAKPAVNEMGVPTPPSLLEIRAIRASQFQVRVDDSPAELVSLTAGDIRSFYLSREIELKELRRGDLKFQYNGKSLEIANSTIKLFNRHLFGTQGNAP